MQFRTPGFAALLVLCLSAFTACRPPASSAPLSREAYVWQRAHTVAVADAVRAHASEFNHLVVLAAEVSWPQGRANIVRVPLALPSLKTVASVGLAIRVNTYSGSFATNAPATLALVDLATSLLTEARAAGLHVTEFQIDFDAPESRLADYRLWLDALRPVVSPARLSFTALPSWLKNRADFAALTVAANDYVLQVHSLTRPKSPDDPIPLCDPDAARTAVNDAARFNRPFRVALPTYGYHLAFDRNGRFFAISAEGPVPSWPADSIVRELGADPTSLANVVAEWQTQHPQALKGIIWYRLPVPGDRLNWSWPTLKAVMSGKIPAARLTVEARSNELGLVECILINSGNAAFTGTLNAELTWNNATRLASDALPPFAITGTKPFSVRFSTARLNVPPETSQSAGWVRFDKAPPYFNVSTSR
jgi:hypothetical protein